MEIVITSDQLYKKVETICFYKPTKEELYYYYSGTHAGINPNNPYAKRSSYSKKYQYVLVKKSTVNKKSVIK